ncbi:MAG: hypothetical protein ACTSVW_01010 [Candidatus Njordarchaeales archaeon]
MSFFITLFTIIISLLVSILVVSKVKTCVLDYYNSLRELKEIPIISLLISISREVREPLISALKVLKEASIFSESSNALINHINKRIILFESIDEVLLEISNTLINKTLFFLIKNSLLGAQNPEFYIEHVKKILNLLWTIELANTEKIDEFSGVLLFLAYFIPILVIIIAFLRSLIVLIFITPMIYPLLLFVVIKYLLLNQLFMDIETAYSNENELLHKIYTDMEVLDVL